MKEIWKSIDELDGYYDVSNFGMVRRAKPGVSTYVGRLLKLHADRDGYFKIQPCVNGKYVCCQVHRLVARAFLGPCPIGMHVNHKDLNPSNNRWDNLEYVTPSENLLHAIRHGVKIGGRTYTKLSWSDVQEIRRLYSRFNTVELAKKFGVTDVTIWRIVNGHERLTA